MSRFFAAGGFGMFPVLLFGFFTVAAAVLFLLRPERRFVAPMIALGLTTLASAGLGFSLGLVSCFRYVQNVPQAEQLGLLSQGIAESLHVLVLALVMLVIAGLIASAGTLRAARAPAVLAG